MIEGSLSLVLPAHNEEDNIEAVVDQAVHTLPGFVDEFEVIIVNDGSTDSTGQRAHALTQSCSPVRVVDHDVNRGYGAALRSGFETSSGDWVMVMDSDRQFDIGDLVYLAPFTSEYDLIAGYRIQRNDPFHRTLFGKTFRLAMRILFGVQLRDIDCAFKLIRGGVLRSLKLESDGAMISTELMARWARSGATWTQVGVHHYPRTAGEQSGGSLRVILRAIRDVPRLWLRLNREPIPERVHDTGPSGSTGVTPAAAFSLIAVVMGVVLLIAARVFRQKR
jgi:glycosyltransferase involved in cell wall biosynthesis